VEQDRFRGSEEKIGEEEDIVRRGRRKEESKQ